MTSQISRCVEADGTPLAPGLDVSPHPTAGPSVEAIWRRQRDHFFVAEVQNTSRYVMGAGALVQLLTFGILIAARYPMWRICLLFGFYCAFQLAHRWILGCVMNAQRLPGSVMYMSISALAFVTISTALTGGVHSIFLPSIVLPAIVSLLYFGPQAVARWTAIGNALLIVAVVALPPAIAGPEIPAPYYTVGMALSLVWFVFMIHMLVGKLAVSSARAGQSMACLREERLSGAEEQLRRLQSVGAKVAHELKNPLASIKGLCQLVARTPSSERTQDRLVVVASEISRMETILNEYLSFSRPLEDLRPEPIDLLALARDVLDVLDGRAQQAGVGTSLAGTAGRVQGDPRRLKEALINLVSNAIEATPSGGTVALRVRTEESGVRLEVVDSGRGISTEDLGRLGTSFFTTRPNGTGLGVVLAQGVIAQHGGSLEYKSAVGKGTTATIALPLPAPRTLSQPITPEPTLRAAIIEARA